MKLFQKYGGRILLLGDPGTGKTTALMAFARNDRQKVGRSKSTFACGFLPVATWDEKNALQSLNGSRKLYPF